MNKRRRKKALTKWRRGRVPTPMEMRSVARYYLRRNGAVGRVACIAELLRAWAKHKVSAVGDQ